MFGGKDTNLIVYWNSCSKFKLFLFLAPLFTEKFYRSVHALPRMSGAGGLSKCPFRAAVQSQRLHTAAPASQTSPAVSEGNKAVVSAQLKQEVLPREGVCGVKRATKDGNCECAAQGLQPVGESMISLRVVKLEQFCHF